MHACNFQDSGGWGKVSLSSRLAWAIWCETPSQKKKSKWEADGGRKEGDCRQLILILPSCSSYCLRYKRFRNPSYGFIRVFSTSLRIKKHKHLQHWPWYFHLASLSFWAPLFCRWFSQLILMVPSLTGRQWGRLRECETGGSYSFLAMDFGCVWVSEPLLWTFESMGWDDTCSREHFGQADVTFSLKALIFSPRAVRGVQSGVQWLSNLSTRKADLRKLTVHTRPAQGKPVHAVSKSSGLGVLFSSG